MNTEKLLFYSHLDKSVFFMVFLGTVTNFEYSIWLHWLVYWHMMLC